MSSSSFSGPSSVVVVYDNDEILEPILEKQAVNNSNSNNNKTTVVLSCCCCSPSSSSSRLFALGMTLGFLLLLVGINVAYMVVYWCGANIVHPLLLTSSFQVLLFSLVWCFVTSSVTYGILLFCVYRRAVVVVHDDDDHDDDDDDDDKNNRNDDSVVSCSYWLGATMGLVSAGSVLLFLSPLPLLATKVKQEIIMDKSSTKERSKDVVVMCV